MPRRSDDFMARRPRTIVRPDGSFALDPRDYGPCAVDQKGNAIMGNITGSHGPRLRDSILRDLPSPVLSQPGPNSGGAHKRRRKGGRPGCAGAKNRTLIKNALADDIHEHGKLHVLFIYRRLSPAQWQHFMWLCQSLVTAKQLDRDKCIATELREIGRAKKQGLAYSTMYTSTGGPAPAPRTIPVPPRPMPTMLGDGPIERPRFIDPEYIAFPLAKK